VTNAPTTSWELITTRWCIQVVEQEGSLPRHLAWIVCVVVIAALTSAGVAVSKGGFTTTTCGRDRCRTVTNGISGIGTLPGRVSAPRSGRFFTISLRMETNGRPAGWKVVYEAKRQIVRALDWRARSFMGTRWARLTRDVRPHYAKAVRGLAPLRSAPRMSR
jgi:hypothetical protein